MSTFHSSLVAIVLIAACEDDGRTRNEHEIDAASFRQTLQCGAPSAVTNAACDHLRDDARRIESIKIEPRGPSSARYVITWKDRAKRDVVYAEFPGRITDEITAAGIMYSVK